ncbi:hypothetical protein BV497_15500 [Fulvimonas soli]|nr:hypothetical protein BV497_15500 [Fulvimonas soli]
MDEAARTAPPRRAPEPARQRNDEEPPMRDARDWMPPLLRCIGTMLILVASVYAVGIEQHEQAQRAQQIAAIRSALDPAGLGAGPRDRQADLAQEVRLLRLQIAQGSDLTDEVFKNPWFQWLGLIGTLLIAGSFLVEAVQKAGPGKGGT